ncbi:unnamed protein product [Fraxinus pennsylvanica]|uniref:Uncharacterized protein n=1 Tax=Fraxinus pennsylvanica TaxID=56036 RepID=A0AAD2AEC8_9LAMI|nr:unnamed protein product [Fraxinus pennsylvanica]
MSKRDSGIRRRLTDLEAVSTVLDYVNSSESGLQEKALHLVLNLSLDDDNKVGLVAEGVIEKVVSALRCGDGDLRAVAATVLTNLAVVEVNKITIGSYGMRKKAATALFTLCSFPDNWVRAVQNNAVSRGGGGRVKW